MGRIKHTIDTFIDKARQVHGDRYSYNLVEYKSNKIKVKIVCPIHGVFEQRPGNHFHGFGCSECSGKKQYTTNTFIDKARQVHGDKYDYSLVEYKTSHTKVKIICSIHGVFEQLPYQHLKGHECFGCKGSERILFEEFVCRSKQVHGDRYDYDESSYTDIRNKVRIICPIHGEFEQVPYTHINGCNCPRCTKHISGQEIEFVEYIKSLYSGTIITNTRSVIPPYEIDVYLPDKKIAFEYNGEFWHQEGVNKPIGYHQMKTDMCMDKGVKLHHIWESNWVGDNTSTKDIIMKEIS